MPSSRLPESGPNSRREAPRRRVNINGASAQRDHRSTSGATGFRAFLKRRPKLAGLASITPILAVATLASGIATANACYPIIKANADCEGKVTFSATAWNEDSATEDTRTNNKIDIQYSINGDKGPFESVESTNGVDYAFNRDNDFSFEDTFQLPANLKRPTNVTVQAVALVKWGEHEDFDEADQARSVTIRVPGDCAVPKATITGPDCKSAQASAVLINDGQEPVEFKLYKDNSAEPFETQTVEPGNKVLKIDVTKAFDLKIKAPGMKPVSKHITLPEDCVKPLSTVSQVCKADGSGWTTTFDNTNSRIDHEFVVKSGDKTLDTVTVEAGETETKSYSFADAGIEAGKSIPLVVLAGGKTVLTQSIANDCTNVSADVAAECDTAAGSGAVLSFTNTGKLPETFTVARDGKAVAGSPFTLEPSEMTTQKLLKLDNGETATVTIVGSSGLTVQKSVTLSCPNAAPASPPAQVLGSAVDRPELADTGSEIGDIAELGSLLMAAGVALLGLRRRPLYVG